MHLDSKFQREARLRSMRPSNPCSRACLGLRVCIDPNCNPFFGASLSPGMMTWSKKFKGLGSGNPQSNIVPAHSLPKFCKLGQPPHLSQELPQYHVKASIGVSTDGSTPTQLPRSLRSHRQQQRRLHGIHRVNAWRLKAQRLRETKISSSFGEAYSPSPNCMTCAVCGASQSCRGL